MYTRKYLTQYINIYYGDLNFYYFEWSFTFKLSFEIFYDSFRTKIKLNIKILLIFELSLKIMQTFIYFSLKTSKNHQNKDLPVEFYNGGKASKLLLMLYRNVFGIEKSFHISNLCKFLK